VCLRPRDKTALLNLIGNAVLASAKGDTVCTTLSNASRDGQKGLCIAVQDHGTGIDDAGLAKTLCLGGYMQREHRAAEL
jgi:anti-sigma regulatory factor (Ser/Thr protein kinase)